MYLYHFPYIFHTNIHTQLSLGGGLRYDVIGPGSWNINVCLVFLNRERSYPLTDTKQAHISIFGVVVRQGTIRYAEHAFASLKGHSELCTQQNTHKS